MGSGKAGAGGADPREVLLRATRQARTLISKPLSFIWWGETEQTLETGLVT